MYTTVNHTINAQQTLESKGLAFGNYINFNFALTIIFYNEAIMIKGSPSLARSSDKSSILEIKNGGKWNVYGYAPRP